MLTSSEARAKAQQRKQDIADEKLPECIAQITGLIAKAVDRGFQETYFYTDDYQCLILKKAVSKHFKGLGYKIKLGASFFDLFPVRRCTISWKPSWTRFLW
jgi:hypothetical protein